MPRKMLLGLVPFVTARSLADVRFLELFGVDLEMGLEVPLAKEGSVASWLGAGDWVLDGRRTASSRQLEVR